MVPSTTLEKRYERGRERPRFVSHCKFRLGLGCICELHMCRVGCACACACACCVSVTMGPGYGSNSVRASLSSKSGGGDSVRIQKENLSMPLLGESLSSKSERKHFSMPLLEGVKPCCCREFSASLPKTPVRCMISSERGRNGGGDIMETKQASKPLRPLFPNRLVTGVLVYACLDTCVFRLTSLLA